MSAQKIDTSLDKYGSLLGLPRNDGESLSTYKRRIVAAQNTKISHSLVGLENALTLRLGSFKLLSIVELSSRTRILKEGTAISLYDHENTQLETFLLKETYENLVSNLNAYGTVNDYREGEDNPPLFLINTSDNLKRNALTASSNKIEVLPHSNIGTIVFSDTRYQEVSNIDYVSNYTYYVDYVNGIIFCGNELRTNLNYTYYDDIRILQLPATITPLNSFPIESLISGASVSPLTVEAKNSMPSYNVWR